MFNKDYDIVTMSFDEVAVSESNFVREVKGRINSISLFNDITDDDLKDVYNILRIKFGCYQVRYEVDDLFFNDLSIRVVNYYPSFKSQVNYLKDLYSKSPEDLLAESDITTDEGSYSSNTIGKTAQTPTIQNPTGDIWRYSNAAQKNDESGENSRTISTERRANVLSKQSQIRNMLNLQLERFYDRFVDLFVMVR